MTTPRSFITAAAIAVATIAPTAAARAASRAPIKDCGDVATLDEDDVFIGAVTGQGSARVGRARSGGPSAPAPGCRWFERFGLVV
jgi:hypothetical protein